MEITFWFLIENIRDLHEFSLTLIVPSEIQVPCFIGADNLQEILGDFTNVIKWDNTNEVVKKCANFAHVNDCTFLALGQNDLCLPGPDTRHSYYVSGTNGTYSSGESRGGARGSYFKQGRDSMKCFTHWLMRKTVTEHLVCR